MTDEAGSAWWAELAFGGLCCLTTGLFVLAGTSIGPFASLQVLYGTIPATLYLLVTLAIGLGFLGSGLSGSPYAVTAGASPDDTAGNADTLAGRKGGT